MSAAEIDDLLEGARTNNAAANVTGLLLFDGHNFMQLLEGPQEKVEEVFTAIVADPRHSGLVRIVSEADVDRQFPGWSMGYAFTSGAELPSRQGWFPLTNGSLQTSLPSRVDPAIRMLFTSFLSADKPARD